MLVAVVDPRNSRGGCANCQNGCTSLLFCNFCRKLHENERIWTPGGARVPGAPVDPPLSLQKELPSEVADFIGHFNFKQHGQNEVGNIAILVWCRDREKLH